MSDETYAIHDDLLMAKFLEELALTNYICMWLED